MLEEKDSLPRGVLTPGAAFRNSRLLQRLVQLGLTFKVTKAVQAADGER